MTAADKLSELLATRPALPSLEELTRWWRATTELLPQLIEETYQHAAYYDVCACGRSRGSSVHAEGAQNGHAFELWSYQVSTPPASGPLDEMAQNLMDELHKMKFEGAPIGIALRIDRLLDKAHALAVVVADTRIRLLAIEAKVGRHA